MDKKIKENLKNAFDDVEAYKDFEKSDIGKKSLIFLVLGLIMGLGGMIWYFIILKNHVSSDQSYDLLSLLFSLSWLGAIFGGLYLGQVRHHYLAKINKKK